MFKEMESTGLLYFIKNLYAKAPADDLEVRAYNWPTR